MEREVRPAGGHAAPRSRRRIQFHGAQDQQPGQEPGRRRGLRYEMGRRPMTAATKSSYRPTEAKYKGGAQEMYVTYDLPQATRSGDGALYPKVKRVYIAG